MNKRLVLRLLGAILLIEALAMAPSLAISLLYGDGDALALLSSMALLAALGFPAWGGLRAPGSKTCAPARAFWWWPSPGCCSAPLARCPL